MHISAKTIKILGCLSLICSLSMGSLVMAEEPIAEEQFIEEESKIMFSGFGSFFATSAGKNDLEYYRDLSNNSQSKNWSLTTDSNLGFQADAEFTPQLSGVVQVVIKDKIENGLDESIQWANLKYQFDSDIAVRAGRMALDLYMMSEYRDVGFAYLWVRPVTEFYSPIVYSHVDGLDATYNKQLDSGFMQFKVFAGYTDTDVMESGESNHSKGYLYGMSLLFEMQQWKIHSSIMSGKITDIDSDLLDDTLQQLSQIPDFLWPDVRELEDDMDGEDSRVSYYSFGVAYDAPDDAFQVQSEISYINSDDWGLVYSTYSAYISIAKPIGEITPFIVLSAIKTEGSAYDVSDPFIPQLLPAQASIQNEFNQGQRDQQTLSLGFRWDIDSNIALKAQWDHTSIDDGKSGLWDDKDYPTDENSMDTFSVGLSFIF